MGKLQGKIALVTGGSTGIGLAAAQRLASEGAHVYITGRRQPELDAAVEKIGGNVTAVRSDVSNLADLDSPYAKIESEQGRLDVIFANAGGGTFAKVDDVTEEQFDREFGINVKGLFFTVQKALPLLKEGSSIILNASIVATKGFENFSVYSATKAAVRSFARTWTTDLKGRGIRVNSLSPGPIGTPGLEGLAPGNVDALKQNLASAVPLGRVGEPDEIAKAVIYLASDDSSFVTGIDLVVDGGTAQV